MTEVYLGFGVAEFSGGGDKRRIKLSPAVGTKIAPLDAFVSRLKVIENTDSLLSFQNRILRYAFSFEETGTEPMRLRLAWSAFGIVPCGFCFGDISRKDRERLRQEFVDG